MRRYVLAQTSDEAEFDHALSIVVRYRAAHQYPLAKATMGVRSVVRTTGLPIEVSQRLKRLPTIADKLTREPTMQLATMQDIGGSRAVFDNISALRRVEQKGGSNMVDRIKHFLLVFDHHEGHLVELEEFGEDGDRALAAYAAKERELREVPAMEMVLIGSDSLDTVKLTHANYFDGSVAVSRYLRGILEPSPS